MIDEPENNEPPIWTLSGIGKLLWEHILREQRQQVRYELTAKRVDEIYKTVVTGNGEPSLNDIVRSHEKWITNANRLIWIFVALLAGEALALMVLVIRHVI